MAVKRPIVIKLGGHLGNLDSGDVISGALGEVVIPRVNDNAGSITMGQPVWMDTLGGGVDLTKADSLLTSYCFGVVGDASIATTATGNIVHRGVVTLADWTAITGSESLTNGETYFVDPANAGKLVTAAPSTTGEFIMLVGRAISATELLVEPSGTPIGV